MEGGRYELAEPAEQQGVGGRGLEMTPWLHIAFPAAAAPCACPPSAVCVTVGMAWDTPGPASGGLIRKVIAGPGTPQV